MKKAVPWIIRGIVIAVYICLAIGEVVTFLSGAYELSIILYRIVVIPSFIGFFVHSICSFVHFIMLIIRLVGKNKPEKSLIAFGVCVVTNVIIFVFGLMTVIYSCASASV